MDKVNKKELARRVADRLGVKKKDVYPVIGGIVEEIEAAVIGGERVGLANFGAFEPRNRAARIARNPASDETVPVPARTVPMFQPAVGFRDRVAAATEARRAQALPGD